MLIGIVNNKRETAKPGIKANCPLCGKELIPKCGFIKIWHFAHKVDNQCDNWYEPESDWHFFWKKEFPVENQEVIIEKFGEKHIADISLDDGLVIEFQNSFLSSDEILKREKFYGNMFWVLNGNTLGKNFYFNPKGDYFTFRWKHPPKSWWYAKKPIFIDLNNGFLFIIKKIYQNCPCRGWGKMLTKEEFIKKLNMELFS